MEGTVNKGQQVGVPNRHVARFGGLGRTKVRHLV